MPLLGKRKPALSGISRGRDFGHLSNPATSSTCWDSRGPGGEEAQPSDCREDPPRRAGKPSWEEEGRRLRRRREAAGAVIYNRSNPEEEENKADEGVGVTR